MYPFLDDNVISEEMIKWKNLSTTS
jgi:hypothetical protein